MLKKSLLAVAVAAAAGLPALASAQAASSPHSFTGNVGLFSDYKFRGYTQTNYNPALQGGFDYAHASGFYLGNWNSNVEQSLYTGASLEMDFYGGFKGKLGEATYDLGGIYYYYPGSGEFGLPKVNNGELYVGLGYGIFSAKLFYAVTDYFALSKFTGSGTKTDGTIYLDVGAAYDLGSGWGLNARAGYLHIANATENGLASSSAVDWKLGATKDIEGYVVGLSVLGTNRKDYFLTGTGEDAGKTRLMVSLTKTF